MGKLIPLTTSTGVEKVVSKTTSNWYLETALARKTLFPHPFEA